jgi:membrane-associated protease RseP (regulator of RpoE activity)
MSASNEDWRFPPPEGPPRSSRPTSGAEEPAPASEPAESTRPVRTRWPLNLVLFAATVWSVFEVGQAWNGKSEVPGFWGWLGGWPFAVPLLAILLCHEFGHYVAARLHRVPASLPYFIPFPKLSPFGTFGAVIVMPKRIRSANALLDVGAAGPLAGMAVAIPVMLIGLAYSTVGPRSETGFIQEGQSILYWALKRLVHGPIPATQDVFLHPTALAAWAGFLVTFLNLLPFGQLDGGHVAYALFGEKQNRVARFAVFLPLVMVLYNAWVHVRPLVLRGRAVGWDKVSWLPVSAATVWISIFVLLFILRAVSGADHPPVDEARLSPKRRVVAIVTLALFVLLFMPTPWAVF